MGMATQKTRLKRKTPVIELAVPSEAPAPRRGSSRDAAPALPRGIDPLMGVPWHLDEDIVRALDVGGYFLLQRSPINYQPKIKACARLNAMDLVAVSPDQPGSERQKAFQRMLDYAQGVPNMIDWLMMHGFDEGVTFYQIHEPGSRETGSEYVYPDLTDGGYHKANAAPALDEGLRWNRAAIAKRQSFNPYIGRSVTAAQSFDPANMIVFAPGGTTNSEGNLAHARVLLPVCAQYEEAAKDLADFIHLFGLPWVIRYREVLQAGAGKVEELLRSALRTVEDENKGPFTSMRRGEEDIELKEPQGTACQVIVDRMKDLEAQAHRIWLGNDLTSSTAESGPAGASTAHAAGEDRFIMRYARHICAGIAGPLIRWTDRRNPEFPKLAKGESEIYFQFQPHGRRSLIGLEERAPEPQVQLLGAPLPGQGPAGKQQALPAPPGPAELSTRRRALELARPAALVLPPVHPNCRCACRIDGVLHHGEAWAGDPADVPEGRWIDAQDGKVCRECRAYGAIFNAMERGDVKLSPEEAEAIEDARGQAEFKAALERDAAAEQRAIERAAARDRDGLLRQTVQRRGITPSPAELNQQVNQAMETSRLKADVQAGTPIGQGMRAFVTPEAITAPAVPGGVRPEFIGAVVARGPRYAVLNRWDAVRVIDVRRDRLIASEYSLPAALLLFAWLEEDECERLERRARKGLAVNPEALAECRAKAKK